jgi:hypothetical protein
MLYLYGALDADGDITAVHIYIKIDTYIYTNRYDALVAGLRMLYLYGALDADGDITAVHIYI